MARQIDLSSLSTTFPVESQPPVVRDGLISLLKDKFSNDTKVIVVQGPTGSGKTTLLGQFAKTFNDRCFSYFISKTWPASDTRYFLQEMCEQMGRFLGKPTHTLDHADTDQLETMFMSFYRQIAIKARSTKASIYYPVDALHLYYCVQFQHPLSS